MRTEIPCTLWTDEGEERGIVMDLSHGGALVQARRGALVKGAAFELEIERGDDEPIAVMIEILREEPLESTSTYATRFSLIEPKQEHELAQMIDAMLGPSREGRVQRRVELNAQTPDEFSALATNIQSGQISLQVAVALVLAERVNVVLRMSASHEPLILQGTVAHVRTVDENVFHVGIRFDPLSQDQLDAFLFYRRLFGL